MTKRRKTQFLKRPLRFMVRFNGGEMREFRVRAKKAGLSQAEYGRRKILNQPVPELTQKDTKATATSGAVA